MSVPQSFPAKIYQILENESSEIIRWNNNGLSFRIVDHGRFEREIVPKYFRHNQISSVQRQLNLYGFRCLTRGEYKRSFFHPKFRRGDWETVKTLTRCVTKKHSYQPRIEGPNGELLSGHDSMNFNQPVILPQNFQASSYDFNRNNNYMTSAYPDNHSITLSNMNGDSQQQNQQRQSELATRLNFRPPYVNMQRPLVDNNAQEQERKPDMHKAFSLNSFNQDYDLLNEIDFLDPFSFGQNDQNEFQGQGSSSSSSVMRAPENSFTDQVKPEREPVLETACVVAAPRRPSTSDASSNTNLTFSKSHGCLVYICSEMEGNQC